MSSLQQTTLTAFAAPLPPPLLPSPAPLSQSQAASSSTPLIPRSHAASTSGGDGTGVSGTSRGDDDDDGRDARAMRSIDPPEASPPRAPPASSTTSLTTAPSPRHDAACKSPLTSASSGDDNGGTDIAGAAGLARSPTRSPGGAGSLLLGPPTRRSSVDCGGDGCVNSGGSVLDMFRSPRARPPPLALPATRRQCGPGGTGGGSVVAVGTCENAPMASWTLPAPVGTPLPAAATPTVPAQHSAPGPSVCSPEEPIVNASALPASEAGITPGSTSGLASDAGDGSDELQQTPSRPGVERATIVSARTSTGAVASAISVAGPAPSPTPPRLPRVASASADPASAGTASAGLHHNPGMRDQAACLSPVMSIPPANQQQRLAGLLAAARRPLPKGVVARSMSCDATKVLARLLQAPPAPEGEHHAHLGETSTREGETRCCARAEEARGGAIRNSAEETEGLESDAAGVIAGAVAASSTDEEADAAVGPERGWKVAAAVVLDEAANTASALPGHRTYSEGGRVCGKKDEADDGGCQCSAAEGNFHYGSGEGEREAEDMAVVEEREHEAAADVRKRVRLDRPPSPGALATLSVFPHLVIDTRNALPRSQTLIASVATRLT